MSVSDLFEPLPLLHGPAMRNRFMLAPLTNQQSEIGGALSDDDQHWLRQLSQGGYALIQTSATNVEKSAIACARQPGIYSDDHLPGLTKAATTVRRGGGLSAVQLHHGGHRASPHFGGVPAPASSRTIPGVAALTTEEVQRIRDSFIAGALRAEKAGFDGVSVHGAFGWILSEFLSPLMNDRTDQYGGSVENRARFTMEVIEGIRAATNPSFQIGWRLSIERYGLRLEELQEITAEILRREMIDYLDLALWDYGQIVDEGRYRGRTMLSVFTEIPRKGVRVGAAGRITSAERASQMLGDGCDFVLVGRAGILDRDCPKKIAADLTYTSPQLPVTAGFLREGGLSERFINHLRGWPYFVRPGSI